MAMTGFADRTTGLCKTATHAVLCHSMEGRIATSVSILAGAKGES
jgi:hypothetical protein